MKKRILVLALVAALAFPMSALATSVLTFTDTQLGQIGVASWDWTQGNALAKNSVPLSTDSNNPTSFDLYYQTALSAFVGTNGTAIGGTGLGVDYEITLQAGFSELGYRTDGTTLTGDLASVAQFSQDFNGSVNFFNIYYDDLKDAVGTASNSLAGTGFGDGVSLMSGYIADSSGQFQVILDYGSNNDTDGDGVIDYVDASVLDQFVNNNYPGVYTLDGQGSAVVEAMVDVANVNGTYIDKTGFDIVGFYLDLLFNSSTITPFNEQDPSALIVGQTPNFGGAPIVDGGTPVLVNGFGSPIQGGTDFLFQADGNSSVTLVPEPSTFILLGLGLVGIASRKFMRRK